MNILSGKCKMMFHVHKQDDIMVLLQLVKEFGIKEASLTIALMYIDRKCLKC